MLSFMHVKMPLGTQDPHPPAQVWEPSVSVLYTANRTVPVSLTPGFPQKKLSLEAIVQGQRTQQSLGRNFPITGATCNPPDNPQQALLTRPQTHLPWLIGNLPAL